MFLRLSEKPIDLIKNPIIRIVRSVRVGLMVRSKFRPLGAQFEPLEIDFSAFRSQFWNSGSGCLAFGSQFLNSGFFVLILGILDMIFSL